MEPASGYLVTTWQRHKRWGDEHTYRYWADTLTLAVAYVEMWHDGNDDRDEMGAYDWVLSIAEVVL